MHNKLNEDRQKSKTRREEQETKVFHSRKEKLEFLALNYNPYILSDPAAVTPDIYQLLLEFDLDPLKHDPYFITNQLLVLLDQEDDHLEKDPTNIIR